MAELDLVRQDAGDDLLREVQPSLVDIRNEQRRRTRSAAAESSDEPNGARAADHDRVTKLHARAVHTCERDAQGLEHSAVLPCQVVRQLVAPHGWVLEVAAQKAGDGRRGKEENGLAAIVAAREAGLAGVAGDVRLDGDAVAGLYAGD